MHNLKKIKTNKKAAIELSIGTIVIIVIAMTMLIMGIVLVRNIFAGATESVDTLNDKVRAEITNIFSEEGADLGVKLGANKLAKIKEGSGEFGIAFGARNTDGPVMDANGVSKIQYQVELISQGSDCVATTAASWFKDPIISGTSSGKISFLDAQGGSGYGIIFIEIPEGASECSQKVKISTYKTGGAWITSQSFRIEIISGGIFS